ncbi:MAG: hypothetical protein K1W38_04570 [Lachnospiraceae bacterium]|jgi:hypothetical protein
MGEKADSFVGMIRQIVQESRSGILTCSVTNTNPVKLRVQGNADAVIFNESLIIPAHVQLDKGNTAYLMQCGDNSYFVLGKGK